MTTNQKTASRAKVSETIMDFAHLRSQNARYSNNNPVPYQNGDGFTAYVLEKYKNKPLEV